MNVPSHLYKYRSLRTKKDREHTLRILTHNEIYFAKYKMFNDPFDCQLHISFNANPTAHKNTLRQLNPGLSEAQIEIQTQEALQVDIGKREQKFNNGIRRETEKLGIFCMSAKRDNLLMWSHYADYHEGICMEFKTTGGRLFGCDLLDVDYDKYYPSLSVYDNWDLDWVRKYLRTKSLDWGYEKEWRILYKEIGCQFFRSEDEELSGVILGSRISRRNKELVVNSCSENNCKAKLYQARECKDRFGLDITLIE